MPPNALQSELIERLRRDTNHDAIVTEAPKEQSRLTFVDTACLVINRMIGESSISHPLSNYYVRVTLAELLLLLLLAHHVQLRS